MPGKKQYTPFKNLPVEEQERIRASRKAKKAAMTPEQKAARKLRRKQARAAAFEKMPYSRQMHIRHAKKGNRLSQKEDREVRTKEGVQQWMTEHNLESHEQAYTLVTTTFTEFYEALKKRLPVTARIVDAVEHVYLHSMKHSLTQKKYTDVMELPQKLYDTFTEDERKMYPLEKYSLLTILHICKSNLVKVARSIGEALQAQSHAEPKNEELITTLETMLKLYHANSKAVKNYRTLGIIMSKNGMTDSMYIAKGFQNLKTFSLFTNIGASPAKILPSLVARRF